MARNKNLNKARNDKFDEFYTLEQTIDDEIIHYITESNQFEDKIVFCNCDDPEWSSFWKYFVNKFEDFRLKKVVSTHLRRDGEPSYKIEYEGNRDEFGNPIYIRTNLAGNGDFRSKECISILKEADIVVTNPPYSLFREYVDIIEKHNKKFVILGNINAITYKNVMEYIKSKKLTVGYNFNKTVSFIIPNDRDTYDHIDTFGNKIAKVTGISWYTNLHKTENKTITLQKKYKDNPEMYPKYVNYNAIEVSKIRDIPIDFNGIMGVPITFLGIYNPTEYELIGHSGELCEKMSTIAKKGEYIQGGLRPYLLEKNGMYKYKRLYDRLFVRRRNIS